MSLRNEYYYSNNRINVKFKVAGTKTTNSQRAFTCSKLTTETLEQGVKYVQS